MVNESEVIELLSQIPDPEIPVVDIVGLGLVRGVKLTGPKATVTFAPSYSGCPALEVIEQEIKDLLHKNGFQEVQIERQYSPPWTTEWITNETKQKLKTYGIAPPDPNRATAECPRCHSHQTELRSQFGSTACKSIHYCPTCQEPFELFKIL